jgi:integrase/recombinase XerD
MFKSILSTQMKSFLELRATVVAERTYLLDVQVLKHLDCFLVESDYHSAELSEDILNAWINSLSGSSKTIHNKVGTVRNFVMYLNELGNMSFVPYSPKVKSDYMPYIYSDSELELIFYHADNLPINPTKRSNPYLAAMMPMILRILYSCGTRLGETMALQRKDIDFKARTIFLRNTKFSKERLIPIHDTLIDIMEKYCLLLGIMNNPDAFLFPGAAQGHHFSKRQVLTWFHRILQLADIAQTSDGQHERGACLHSFRHVFVLKSMQQLEQTGHPVDMNDLLLPTYLGHKCLLDTDRYMRFAGVQIPETLTAFEAFTNGLIPKVEVPQYEE